MNATLQNIFRTIFRLDCQPEDPLKRRAWMLRAFTISLLITQTMIIVPIVIWAIYIRYGWLSAVIVAVLHVLALWGWYRLEQYAQKQ